MKNRKKILCVNPGIHDFAAYDYWMKPAGLLMVLSLLHSLDFETDLLDCLDRQSPFLLQTGIKPQKPGKYGTGSYHSEVIPKPEALKFVPKRFRRYGLPPSAILARLQSGPRPDAVFVTSAMTYWYSAVIEIIGLVKSVWPDVPVALGGSYARLLSDHARNCSGADFIHVGSDTASVLSLIRKIPGLDLPIPEITGEFLFPHLPDMTSYHKPGFHPLLTGLGCPCKCSYCAAPVLWPDPVRRPVESILSELRQAAAKGIRDFAFYDDALLADSDGFLKPLLRAVSSGRERLRFHTPNGLHSRLLDNETARLMRRAGFIRPRLSLETSDETVQLRSGGKVTSEDLRTAVGHLRDAGYPENETGVYLLAGMPGQSVLEIRESIRFVRSLGCRPYLAEYALIPGTRDWEALESNGKLPEDPLLHNNSVYPVWSGCMDWQELDGLKRSVRS